MPGRLEGKVAIVTGGGSGFGKAISTKYIAEGAKVMIAELRADAGSAVAKELGCESVEADVTKRADWEKVLKQTVDTYGGVDIVVNNAGACYSRKPTGDTTEDDFDLCIDVNLKSIYQSVVVIVPWMQKNKKGGSFIQISSTASLRPKPMLTWYNASKAGASNATRTMALEYAGDNIRFNAVCPQFASTGLSDKFLGMPNTEENRANFVSMIPLGRLTDVTDIANAVAYLGSDEASFITGIELPVDGGRSA